VITARWNNEMEEKKVRENMKKKKGMRWKKGSVQVENPGNL
jgi:hypothetical protein